MRKRFSLLTLSLVVLFTMQLTAQVIYVKPDAASTAWNDKTPLYTDLQSAINAASSGDQIWLAAGTYKPTNTTDRTISFTLKDGVAIYGGFAGTETTLTQRNWTNNKTILSGDIGTVGVDTDNSYHVITGIGTSEAQLGVSTWLDGVIVEKGYGKSWLDNKKSGGGLYLDYASPTIVNCIFQNNYVSNYGGALYATNSESTIANTLFINNKSNYGGAVYSESAMSFVHCNFINNQSENYGGAICSNTSSTKVTNSIAWGNRSKNNFNQFYTLTCTNSCVEGGYFGTGNINTDPLFIDAPTSDYRLNATSPCIDKGSNTDVLSWLTNDFLSSPRIANSTADMGMFEGGVTTPEMQSPLDQAILAKTTTSTPLTWQWVGTQPSGITGYELEVKTNNGVSAYFTTTNLSYTLNSLSSGQTIQWRVRGIDGTSLKNWSVWSAFHIPHTHPIFVKPGGTGSGVSWTDAIGNLQDAINTATSSDEIWVAAGTYKPTTTTDRTISFTLKDGVAIYGGFNGTETELNQRSWTNNKTILSGDIGTEGVDDDNSYHVITGIGTNTMQLGTTTWLDGFIVEKGNGNGWSNNRNSGGGLYLDYASPTIVNCIFQNNNVSYAGGAIYSSNSTSNIANTLFINNNSGNRGGAVHTQSAISFAHCNFINNRSEYYGGAVYSSTYLTKIVNSIAWGNSAKDSYDQFNSVACSYSCVEGGYSGTGNVSANPLLIDASTNDYRLNAASPCIDKGSNTGIPTWLTTDFEGSPRIANTTVDMGMYEGGVTTPLILAPLDQAILAGTTTSTPLTWQWPSTQPTEITGYELEVKTNNGASVYYTTTNLSYTLNSLISGNTVQWRVRGVEETTLKNWSPWGTFYIPHAHPIYVKTGGTGSGTSWADAMGSLQDAINTATYGDQIWVAAGTYKPTTTTDRAISFNLKDGVAIYGGFAGTETTLTQRNWTNNKTILSGDIGIVGVDTDNSYHVITGIGTGAAPLGTITWLDGFIIEKGYGNVSSDNQNLGGGIYLKSASPTIVNCVFQNNYVSNDGGALYANNSESTIANTLFINNKSNDDGGAVYTQSAISFVHCNFINNRSEFYGGALYSNTSSTTVTNSIAWGNSAKNGYDQFSYSVTCTYSCVEGSNSGNGNISTNPLLIDVSENDCRLNSASPCIDKGSNNNTPSWLTTDFTGASRFQGIAVDIGIYEGGIITPVVQSPLDKAVLSGTDTSVLLTWQWSDNQPVGITGYEIEVQVNDGISIYYNSSELSYTLEGLTPTTSYQWRVRGLDSTSLKNWSAWYSFHIPHAHPIYVKFGGTGLGTSWDDAHNRLQDAIDMAVYGDQIWVQARTYKPTITTDRTISFTLKDGVEIYGGFDGTETELNQRNWTKNKTILSGAIGLPESIDNSYHVITGIGTNTAPLGSATRLDGLIIEHGYADGTENNQDSGGGLYLNYASPTIVNCIFQNNYVSNYGGALYAYDSESTIANTLFINNKSKNNGGAVYTQSPLNFAHCNFINNRSEYFGGAVNSNTNSDSSSTKITNSIAWGNSAKYNGNQFYRVTCSYSCVEGGYSGTGNVSTYPMFMDTSSNDVRLILGSPCIDRGSNSDTPSWLTTDFTGASRLQGTTVDMGIFEGGVTTPLVQSPLDKAVLSGTDTSALLTWQWQDNQPVGITGYEIEVKVNDGTSVYYNSSELSYTLEGLTPTTSYQWRVRGLDGSSLKSWSAWHSFYIPRAHPIYIKPYGNGSGTSWDDAMSWLQDAIDMAGYGDQIWVATGTYKPTIIPDRTKSFTLKDGVKIYGGFNGTETELNQRNWTKNRTILSGAIGFSESTDNSYHVVSAFGTSIAPLGSETRLDGLIIEHGYADGTDNNQNSGGGLYLNYASPTIVNCIFQNNFATNSGAALYAIYSTSTIANTLFVRNHSNWHGGAIYTSHALSFSHCNFINNQSEATCGAINSNTSSTKITNSIAWGNRSKNNINHFSNVAYTYSCVEGSNSGTGNISTYPMLMDTTWNDVRIRLGSPCIDTGDSSEVPVWLSTDFNNAARIQGTTVDMGMSEGGVESPTPTSPSNNFAFDKTQSSVTFAWTWPTNAPAGVTQYYVELEGNDNYSSYATSDTLFVLKEYIPEGSTIRWRVSGDDGSEFYNPSEWFTFTNPHRKPLYVKSGSSGNGTSWSNAFGTLQEAINAALPYDQIWVAAGTYKPTTTTDRTISFKLKDGVEIYGGFAGTETTLTQRNWTTNKTILSGDIGTVGVDTDNSYHVITGIGTSSAQLGVTTLLDGLIIEKGYGDGTSDNQSYGGGLFLKYASPTIVNCIFQDNYAKGNGGAINASNSMATIANTLFVRNSSNSRGGAIYTSTPLSFSHCNFINNRAEYFGGAISSNYSTKVTNSIAWGNSTKDEHNNFTGVTCNYNCVEGGYSGIGNISTNPLFADPANGNYRLLVNSPAINKGSVTAIPTGLTNDFDGLARQMGTAPDMGMYEGAFVTNFEPSNNGVAKPSMFFGTNLMWGYTTESIGTVQAGTQFAVQVWENGKPETLVVDAQPWQTATVTTGSIQFNKTYQWKVGVVINNHTYWSNAATFYVGRENPIHVKPGGTGNGDSWSAALGSLTDALNLATPGDRIWVSAGTYKPTTGTDRNISFKLKSNVEVLGGFIDGGTISSRNPAKNVTILSGDIGATGVDTDNSYHVIYNNYTSSTPLENAVLDGFIITGGNAGTFNGGGMLNEYASPTIRYCKFYNNKATNGGAISNSNSSPRISNSLFYSNSATDWGGAIYADRVSLPVIINCTITENNAEESAGGFYGTGTIGNSILYGNTCSNYYYKQIYNGHTLTISNSCIEGGYVGKDNVSGNPHFLDITSRNYRIGSFSSCYEKGNNALLTSEETFYDLSFGEARILGTVDIGAYEIQASVSAGSIEITQITPSNNAAQVDIATPIVITFNQPIFVNSSLITLSGNSIKRQRMSNDRMTLTLEMSDPWEFNQSYTVTFTEGAFTHINNDLFTNVNSSISFTVRDCVNGAIQLTASQAEPCPYTNVTLEATVTGDVNNDYSWKFNNALLDSLDGKTSYEIDRVSNSNVGVYSFSVSDMCGSSISSIFNLQLKAGLNKPVIKKKWDDVYLVDNSSNLFSNYVWEYGGWKITDPKQYVFISSNSIGKLVVKATDAESGCTVVSDTLNLALQAISKSLSVSPNPVKQSNTVNISFVGGNQSGTIQLFDSKGVLISTAKFEDVNSYPFDKTNLSPGLYLLEIVGNQTQSIVKLIIE